jgi:hypothetical protein
MISNEPLVRIGTAVTNFALKAHLPVDGLIRATVFDHFCGGVNEMDCLKVVDNMFTKGVSSVLDYSVEGKEEEEQFDAALEMTLKTVEFAKERQAIPFAVFKPTGLGRLDLYNKIGEKQPLSEAEQAEWNRVKERFEIICKTAHSKNVALLIDGEESWMQDAADNLVEDMMRKYNKEKAIVFNTLQMYRHDRLAFLKKTHQEGQSVSDNFNELIEEMKAIPNVLQVRYHHPLKAAYVKKIGADGYIITAYVANKEVEDFFLPFITMAPKAVCFNKDKHASLVSHLRSRIEDYFEKDIAPPNSVSVDEMQILQV